MNMTEKSFFSDVQLAPADSIFGLQANFVADQNPNKINMIVGAYRDENGDPYILPVVRSVETSMASDPTLNHEYLPIEGLKDLIDGASRLALGDNSTAITENRVCGIQTLSGTGALSVTFQFLFRHYEIKSVHIPKPTWANHSGILNLVGYQDVTTYRYLDPSTQGLDIKGFLEDLNSMKEKSIILLHACAQNPCGVDPTQEEWKSICDVIEKRHLLPVFDMAYQGFASGDFEKDAWALQYFEKRGIEMFICQSFAKIFGLYNERVGCLTIVCKDSKLAMNVLSNLKIIARRNYSNPPNHGGRIVATILNNKALFAEWKDQLRNMVERILTNRRQFFDKLMEIDTPGDWHHILKQNGMFTYTGLTPKQVAVLKEKYHIYMLGSGRINMCAINRKNIDVIAKAFKDVVENHS